MAISLLDKIKAQKAQKEQSVDTSANTLAVEQKAVEQQETPAPVAEPVVEVITIVAKPKAFDMDSILDEKLGMTDKFIAEEAAIECADIVPRIRQLNELSEMDAVNEMKLLKNALMANPEAVALMLPEDIGELVACLRRITHTAVTAELDKKAKSTKKAKVDPAAFMNLSADDF